MACVRDENHLGSPQFKLPDEMIEFAAEDALLRARRRRFETWKQEDILHAVGLGSFHPLRLLGPVSGDGEDDDIVGPCAFDECADLAQHACAVGLYVEQGGDVAHTHGPQACIDILSVRRRSLQFPEMLVLVDADHQRADFASVRIAEPQRSGRRRRMETNA